VGIDFDESGSPWILTREMGIYYFQGGQWISFEPHVPDDVLSMVGGCPSGMKVDSARSVMIRIAGCCEAGIGSGIYFDGNVWERTDEPEIKNLFRWSFLNDAPLYRWDSQDRHQKILAIYETDGTLRIMPFFSWVVPPRATYAFERPDSVIYITNEFVAESELLIVRYDRRTRTWRSFMFEHFQERGHFAAQVDEEGYIWLDFVRRAEPAYLIRHGELYRFSPDIFDDYQSPNIP
jgi:hypothetical protein